MSAWTYSDWDEQTAAADKLTRLKLHIKEVTNKISADLSAHGYSRQNHPLIELLKMLRDEEKSLRVAAAVGGGTSLATFPKR